MNFVEKKIIKLFQQHFKCRYSCNSFAIDFGSMGKLLVSLMATGEIEQKSIQPQLQHAESPLGMKQLNSVAYVLGAR